MSGLLKLSKDEEDRANELHSKAIVINAMDPTHNHDFNEVYIRQLFEGGLTAVSTASIHLQYDNFRSSIDGINCFYKILEKFDDKMFLATSVDDIYRAKRENRIALLFALRNLSPIEDDIGLLTIMHKLGVRISQLTYHLGNLVGGGCDERTSYGLTKYGLQAVEELNRLGILIDLAHTNYETFMDAIEVTKAPLSYTHGCASSLSDHMRNLKDDQIKALAEKEGVMGICALSPFLKPQGPIMRTTIDDFLDHIDYVRDLVGIDYVGLGIDVGGIRTKEDEENETPGGWCWGPFFAEGLEDPTGMINVTRGLVHRGYSDQEILKVLGENFIKIYKKVWK